MLCKDFLNSLEEKITAHFGTIYLISFTKPMLRIKNRLEFEIWNFTLGIWHLKFVSLRLK